MIDVRMKAFAVTFLLTIIFADVMVSAKSYVDKLDDHPGEFFNEYRLRGLVAGHVPRVTRNYRKIPL